MRWQDGGESERTNPTWTTTNLAVRFVIITTRISWLKFMVNAMLINSTSKDLPSSTNQSRPMHSCTPLKLLRTARNSRSTVLTLDLHTFTPHRQFLGQANVISEWRLAPTPRLGAEVPPLMSLGHTEVNWLVPYRISEGPKKTNDMTRSG